MKRFALLFTTLSLIATPAMAQNGLDITGSNASSTDRDASFLPPVAAMPFPAPTQAVTAPTELIPAAPLPTVPTIPAQTAQLPAAAPTPIAKPVELAVPVEGEQLGDIDPQSIGLADSNNGGLGATLWKGTTRQTLTRLLGMLNLPTSSTTLNSLAQRLLLTTASVPADTSKNASTPNLNTLRIEKLVTLGDVSNAWRLASLAKVDTLDDITLRELVEASLTSKDSDVCAKLPDIMRSHSNAEWQQMLIICQMRNNDNKAAQLGLDLLRAQGLKDNTYFQLAEKNVIAGSKTLPRQLTPITPTTLAMLQMVPALPIPGEVYSHAPAALIAPLLQLKGRDETPRISVAERAAASGMVSVSDLSGVYANVTFPEAVIKDPASATNLDAQHLRALAYQTAMRETQPDRHVAVVNALFLTTPPALMSGNMAQLLAVMLEKETASTDLTRFSTAVAHIFLLANRLDEAKEWLKIARAAPGTPDVVAELNSLWPLVALANLESDTHFAIGLNAWLDAFLQQPDARLAKDRAATILLLLDAAGFAVADEAWLRVTDTPSFEKRVMPSSLMLERLRSAATAGRRGEVVLLTLLIGNGMSANATNNPNGNKDELSPLATIEMVRALRLVGLNSEAQSLAREMVNALIAAPVK